LKHETDKVASSNHARLLLPGLIFALGIMFTWLFSSSLRQQEQNIAITEFKLRSNELVTGIERQLLAKAEILHGAAGLFASSEYVSRNEFKRYVQRLNLPHYNPSILGLSYSTLIADEQKKQHIADINAEGLSDYTIKPAGTREVYAPVVYIEPETARNLRALGFDNLSEPIRRIAATHARDTGEATMSDKIILKQETTQAIQSGILIFEPVYKNNMPTATTDERQKNLAGWVTIAIRIGDMLNLYLNEYSDFSHIFTMRIYSGHNHDYSAIMFDSFQQQHATPSSMSDIEEIRTVSFLGTTWTIHLKPLPEYWLQKYTDKNGDIVIVSGIILSLLSAFVSYIFLNSHLQIRQALLETSIANKNLIEKETLLRSIYDNSQVAVVLVNIDGIIIYTNQMVTNLFSCSKDEIMNHSFYLFISPAEQETSQIRDISKLIRQNKGKFTLEHHYQRQDGSQFLGKTSGCVFHNADGFTIGVVMVVDDITDRRKNEEAMQLASTVLNASPGGIMVTNAAMEIIAINPAFTRITGYSAEDVLSKNPRMLSADQQDQNFYKIMWDTIQATGHWEGELINQKKNGQLLPELLSISSVLDKKGVIVNYVGVFLDISERYEAEAKIQYIAHHDYLTGLPNRRLLVERSEQALTLAKRHNRIMAILFIDLNRFKPINDQYGHAVGDEILIIIAKRLLSAIRKSDTVCRQGGDEFVILLPEVSSRDEMLNLAIKCRNEIEQPCCINGIQHSVSASIGIATYPYNGNTIDSIIQAADDAMYCAKTDTNHQVWLAERVNEPDEKTTV
jgi:diguanylate cyclase (GGDEF)-like protein/PAS domain S-box-containing protein